MHTLAIKIRQTCKLIYVMHWGRFVSAKLRQEGQGSFSSYFGFFLVACAGFSHQLIGQSVENLGSKGFSLLFNVVFRRVPFLGRAPDLAK